MIAATSSSSAIQLMYCLPEPRRPPIPSLNGNSRRLSRPPCFASTRPVRVRTTRMPRLGRGLGLVFPRDAHLRAEVATRWLVFGEDVVAAVAVVPDRGRRHEHARLAIERRRACARAARCPASGSRGPAACAAGVHFLSPMPAPARCTTASTPSRPAASIVPASGSHRTSSAPSGSPRTRRSTRWPSARRRGMSAVPIRPCEPVRQMSTGTR